MWTTAGIIISSLIVAVTASTCPQNVSSKCGTPVRRGLNSSDQATLLKAHNFRRNYVALGNEKRGNPGPQPAASNMQIMTWDAGLGQIAQNWADQCTWSHNTCGGTTRYPSVGQNLYALISSSSTSFMNFTAAVESWYAEVTSFNKSSINPFRFTEQTGHYTQLVWATSKSLGCGFIVYLDSSSKLYWYYLVCNYGPAGNVIEGSMYNTNGKPCSACPSKTCDATYTGLCT